MEEKNNKTSELTPRQWSLYNLLKSDTDKWWTQKEICEAIPSFHWIDDDRNNCIEIGNEQRAINESFVTDKIIVTDKHCFKIANVEEYGKYRAKLIQRIKNAVKQVSSWDFKYERNGQAKIFNNVLGELKKENEQFHETFEEPYKEKLQIFSVINGVKVSTRVFINWKDRIAYVVSFKRYQQSYDTSNFTYRATFELANGDIQVLTGLQENSFQFQDFAKSQVYKDFFVKQIM